MSKKLSVEEIRQVNFIRTFDNSFIDFWSLDRDRLSMTVLIDGVRYRVTRLLSSFVARWFIQVWSVKIAKFCPESHSKSAVFFCGYNSSVPPRTEQDSLKFTDNHYFDEVSDSDLC